MVIGSMTVELSLPKMSSHKDKRSRLKPLLSRIGGTFNVSVAEIGKAEVFRSGVIGIATVASEPQLASSVLSGVVNMIKSESDMILVDYTTEML